MTVERVTDLVRYRTIADRETARHQGMTDLQVDAALGYARDRRTIFAATTTPPVPVANGLRAVPPGAEASPLDDTTDSMNGGPVGGSADAFGHFGGGLTLAGNHESEG